MALDDVRQRLYGRYRTDMGMGGSDVVVPSRRAYLRSVIQRFFPPDRDATVLELACGSGQLLEELRRAGYTNACGVDRSPEQVQVAWQAGLRVEEGDLLAHLRNTSPQSVDVVVCFDVIEHLDRQEVMALADLVYRALRGGGRWIVHTVNGESPFFGRVRYGDLTHESAFTESSLGQVARAAGFERILCYEDVPVVHGPASLARRAAWLAVASALKLALAAETGSRSALMTQNLFAVAFK